MKTHRSQNRGFTLVEMMVTVTITAIVLATATAFYTEMSIGHFIVNQRVSQAADLRSFSQDMIYTASRAHQFYLYKSVTSTDRDTPSDQLAIDSSDSDNILHPSGDFIVFVFYEVPKPLAQSYHRIAKLVGYYLNASAGGVGAIKKVTIDLTAISAQVAAYNETDAKTMVEQVMTDYWSNTSCTSFRTYALYARGLFLSETSTEGVGRLFYYRDSLLSMMVAGQLYGTSATSGKRTYTDTFSFSVTPRS